VKRQESRVHVTKNLKFTFRPIILFLSVVLVCVNVLWVMCGEVW